MILPPLVTMASLMAMLGTVEPSLELLIPNSRAFFHRANKSSLCAISSTAPTATRHGPWKNEGWSPTTGQRKVDRRAPFSRSRQDNSYNCTNVYPTVERTLLTAGAMAEDCSDGHESDSDEYLFMGMSDAWGESCSSGSEDDLVYESDVSVDQMSDDEFLVEFGRKPRVFDDTTTMAFYISPVAISQLATGLWTRSRPACVIINTRIPRGLGFDDMDWSADALRMLNTPNAGGSSLLSEVLSCEMLHRCLGATLAKTEMEIRYLFAYQPITDYTICLPNLSPRMHVGVSVTRAFAFKGAYRKADCRQLLWKKLRGILASTRNVVDERFFKQILHVWVPNGKVARTVQATYKSLPMEVTRNSIVVISVVNAPWVFTNRR